MARNLSPTFFGLFLTLTTVFSMLTVLDFGVGGAVMGQVSAALGRGDRQLVRSTVSSALFLLVAIGAAAAAVGLLLTLLLPWPAILGVPPDDGTNVGVLVAIVVLSTAAALPLSVAPRALFGVHRGHVASLFTTAGSILQIGGTVAVALLHPTVTLLLLVSLGSALLAGIATTAFLWSGQNSDLRPQWSDVSRPTVLGLASEGRHIFSLAVIGVIAYQTDTLIIAHYLGSDRVPEYAVPFRFFALVPTFLALFLTPLWASYRDAWARDDVAWIRRAFTSSMTMTAVASTLAAAALVILTPWAMRVWVGDSVTTPPRSLLLVLAAYVVTLAVSGALSIFLNGAGLVAPQVRLGIAMAVCNLVLSIWLVHPLQVTGPLLGTLISQLLITSVPSAVLARRALTHRPMLAEQL